MPATTEKTETQKTTSLKPGDRVRYIGPCMEPGAGSLGTFDWLEDHDLYDGTPRGVSPGFIDAAGNGFYCDVEDLELI